MNFSKLKNSSQYKFPHTAITYGAAKGPTPKVGRRKQVSFNNNASNNKNSIRLKKLNDK